MKTLIIIRHAKAENGYGKPDSRRNLTEKGIRQAELMAGLLKEKGYHPDKIFSSPADRTRETTAIFAQVNQVAEKDIKYFDNLYLGDILQFTETIDWLQENVDTLAIVGHNPGVTNFTGEITGADIDSFPTAGIAIIQIEGGADWQQFSRAKKTLAELLTPQ